MNRETNHHAGPGGGGALKLLGGLALALVGGLELYYRTRENRPTQFLPRQRLPWQAFHTEEASYYSTRIPVRNFSSRYESTVVDVTPAVRLLGKGSISSKLEARAKVTPLHEERRDDGYWAAYIIKAGHQFDVEVMVTIRGPEEERRQLECAVVSLQYQTYSRRALTPLHVEMVLPLGEVDELEGEWRHSNDSSRYPVRTHLLTDIDDLGAVINRYTDGIAHDGDVIVLAESVVAITQGRFRSPRDMQPSWLASRLNFTVPNVGSLSTRYGMQAGIEEVGTLRFVISFAAGVLGKLVGQNGWLYRVAGPQLELIDDVTGTMPPYDKFIVLGPAEPQALVDRLRQQTGFEVAIADVNNLQRALILAHTDGVDAGWLRAQLLDNPHGNSAEQTPIVIVRPKRPVPSRDLHDQTSTI